MAYRNSPVQTNPKWSQSDSHIYVNCVNRYDDKGGTCRDDFNIITDSEASYCEVTEGEHDLWPGWDGRRMDGQTIYLDSQHVEEPNTISRIAAERDALASALTSERERSEREARAHDARLAELHGVIAELVRRRDRQAARRAIPEEPDEEQENDEELELCDSEATQLARDDDTTNNTQRESQKTPSLKDKELNETHQQLNSREKSNSPTPKSERILQVTNRQIVSDGSIQCSRSYSPADALRYPETNVAGRCSVSVASRIRLRKTSESHNTNGHLQGVDVGCELSEHGVGQDLVVADREVCGAALALANARAERYAADCTALEAALAHATNTAQRLSLACARHESCSVGLSEALRAADRAVEAYDVLLALAETATRPHTQLSPDGGGRRAAVCVARALLHRLEREDEGEDARPLPGRPLLSPGPWQDDMSGVVPVAGAQCEWTAEEEARLRAHVSALKARGARARRSAAPPPLHEHYAALAEACVCPNERCSGVCSLPPTGALYQDMETAVLLQEVMVAREERAAAIMALQVERKRNKQCDAIHQQNLSSAVMSHCYGSGARNQNTTKDGAERRKRKSRQRKHRDHLHNTPYSEKQNVDTESGSLRANNAHIGSTKEDVDLQKDIVTSGQHGSGSNKECQDSIEEDLENWEGNYFCFEKDHTNSAKDHAGLLKDHADSTKLFVGSLKEYTGIQKDFIGSTKQIKNKERDKLECRKQNIKSDKECFEAGLTKDLVGSVDSLDLTKDHADLTKDHGGSTKVHMGLTKDHGGLTKDLRGSTKVHMGLTKDHRGLTKDHAGLTKDHAGLTKDCGGSPEDLNLDMDFVSRAVFYEDSSNKNSTSSSPPDVYPESSGETFAMSPASNNLDSSPHKELSGDELLSPTFRQNGARIRSGSLRMKEERVTQVHGIAKKKLNLSNQNLRSAAETNL